MNTEPVSGTRDFFSQEIAKRNFVKNKIEKIYAQYGFMALETPLFERIECLLGKYGEEGDSLIFRVMKRGDKLEKLINKQDKIQDKISENELTDYGLRYDLTVPLARVACQYSGILPRIFKRYQFQSVYRADRPAKGRYREFMQCDLDVVGSKSRFIEAEILEIVSNIFLELGFSQKGDFVIKCNHRAILFGFLDAAQIPKHLALSTLTAIDKLDKIGIDGVKAELTNRLNNIDSVNKLIEIIYNASNLANFETQGFAYYKKLFENFPQAIEGVCELEEIFLLGNSVFSHKNIELDPFLARGLSYYTGTIFEVKIKNASGSVGAGGRYDNLIGVFGNKQIPSCGFSMGLDRLVLALEEKNLFPENIFWGPEFLFGFKAKESYVIFAKTAQIFRKAGKNIDIYPEPIDFKKFLFEGEKKNAKFLAYLLQDNSQNQANQDNQDNKNKYFVKLYDTKEKSYSQINLDKFTEILKS